MQDYIPREIDINGRIENIVVKQYDNNSRYLHVTISDADLTDGTFELTGCSTALYIKPEGSEDDSGVSFVSGEVADADEGIVTFLLPGGVTQNVGRYECEIWIYQGDETNRPVISTKPFTLVVEKSIKNDSAIEATPDYSALTATMTNYQALKNQIAALVASPAGSGGDVGTEVRDARVGWDGTEYASLGDAVREQARKAVNGGNRFLSIDRLVSLFAGDFNNIPNNRIYPINMDFTGIAAASTNITAASAHAPMAVAGGTLITLGRTVSENHQNGDLQLFTTPDGADWTGEILVREYWDGWNAWHSLTDSSKRVWKGLKISVLGDSISSYQGVSVGNAYNKPSKIPSVNSMWWKQLCRITGAEPLVIDAYASSCCAVASASWTSSITPGVDDSRCRALHTGSTSSGNRIDPDIILIAMGLNDFQANVPLGAWDGHESLASSDTATWRGAYANMLLKIHTEYPDALVFCLSPWFFVRGNAAGVNVNTVGNTYQDYEDAMMEICELMGGVYVDSNNFGFTRQNYSAQSFAFDDNASDGSLFHPNATGQEILGQSIAAAVREKAVGYVNWLKTQKGA